MIDRCARRPQTHSKKSSVRQGVAANIVGFSRLSDLVDAISSSAIGAVGLIQPNQSECLRFTFMRKIPNAALSPAIKPTDGDRTRRTRPMHGLYSAQMKQPIK